MKTIHLRRHSIKDGRDNTIGDNGLKLAYNQGHVCETLYDQLFHGPLVRTAQTALAFCQGLGYAPAIMPVVFGLGDDALFAEMASDEFRAAVKSGLSNFAAVRQTCDSNKTVLWSEQGRGALIAMFNDIGDGDTAIGFFHSPTIELTAWACAAWVCSDTEETWFNLRDMEGLIFTYETKGSFPVVTGKISVQPDAAK